MALHAGKRPNQKKNNWNNSGKHDLTEMTSNWNERSIDNCLHSSYLCLPEWKFEEDPDAWGRDEFLLI